MTDSTLVEPAPLPEHASHRHTPPQRTFDKAIMRSALVQTFRKLTPRKMAEAPVLFVVYVGSIWTTILFLRDFAHNTGPANEFEAFVVAFVWFVVLFGNFAESLAEGRGKAQADSLRKTRQQTVAHLLRADGTTVETDSVSLHVGDRCVVDAGQLIPGDGDVVEGMALVDESAITGESAPVIPGVRW